MTLKGLLVPLGLSVLLRHPVLRCAMICLVYVAFGGRVEWTLVGSATLKVPSTPCLAV